MRTSIDTSESYCGYDKICSILQKYSSHRNICLFKNINYGMPYMLHIIIQTWLVNRKVSHNDNKPDLSQFKKYSPPLLQIQEYPLPSTTLSPFATILLTQSKTVSALQ